MLSPKSLNTIHDLFATTRRESDAPDNEGADMPIESDVYEQLAQLEYIYVDEQTATNVDDSYAMLEYEPISLGDFFEGLAQLATMGVVEVTDIVEAIHREIMLRPIGRFNERSVKKWQRGITGRVYGTIRYIMLLVGNNLSSGVRLYNNMLSQKNVQPLPKSLRRLVNILNGVMGDHLVNHHNPLAVPMVLYDRYDYIQQRKISGRVIILCHGLCMSHLSWHVSKDHDLGERLMSSQPNSTILYLNYNTGQRISTNGRSLSKLLQDLVVNNPDIIHIDLIGHSMGGLVARSALFYGKQQGFDWVKRVSNLVTLGSPHHGASLERIGNFIQEMIAKLPFAGSLAKLGDLRSAGIIDLRHGSIRDADWQSLERRSVLPPEFRHPTPLPLHVRTYLIASTLVEGHYDSKAASLLGDGLVTVDSALGEHTGDHALLVPKGRTAVFYGVSHYNLLYSDRVHNQVIAWLSESDKSEAYPDDAISSSRIYSYPERLNVVV